MSRKKHKRRPWGVEFARTVEKSKRYEIAKENKEREEAHQKPTEES